MPDQKDTLIKSIKEEVNKAISMLHEKNDGADLSETRKLLALTAQAVRKEDFGSALDLAQKAQLAAKPDTEYLLGRANSLENRGFESYKKDEYRSAIEAWQQSLEAYKRASEMANLRGEHEIAGKISLTIPTIENNIKKSSLALSREEMHNLVNQANQMVNEAKTLYDQGKCDEASEKFNNAKSRYSSAAAIARESLFEDETRLSQAAMDMQSSIEACYLTKVENMLNLASEGKAEGKENASLEALKVLESFSSNVPEYENLKKRANAGIAQGRIEVGKNLMEQARDLFKKPDYYNAKERFRKAQEFFNKVSDFTVTNRLESEKSETDALIDTCTAAIRACTDNLIGIIPEMSERLPEGFMDLPKGIVRKPSEVQTSDKDRMVQLQAELKDEYGQIKWLKPGGINYIGIGQDREGTSVILRIPKKLDANRKRSFLQEWKEWETLHHRNIVRLIEATILPPLLVLEYVDGGSLSDYLKSLKGVDIKTACRIIFDVARGLEYAHTKGTIHGDLKPSNILLTKTGEAKVTDWSWGKSYTPGYAAPEQIQSQTVDKKTDVYQLGIIFYEMLKGDNPFGHGSIVEMEKKTLVWTPEKLSSILPGFEPLDDIYSRCLAKQSEYRPTIREFRKAIYDYMKEHHGESLHLTREPSVQIKELSELALLAAKQNETRDLEGALESLLLKAVENQKKKNIQDSLPYMKHINIIFNTIVKDGVSTFKPTITLPQGIEREFQVQDEVVNDVDTLIKSVEYAQT